MHSFFLKKRFIYVVERQNLRERRRDKGRNLAPVGSLPHMAIPAAVGLGKPKLGP